jgi:hypothetical protein
VVVLPTPPLKLATVIITAGLKRRVQCRPIGPFSGGSLVEARRERSDSAQGEEMAL